MYYDLRQLPPRQSAGRIDSAKRHFGHLISQTDFAKGSAMNTVLSYFISIGIITFGFCLIAYTKGGPAAFPVRSLLGLPPIAVGLIRLIAEIRNHRVGWSR